MDIPLIIVLIVAEALLILIGLSVTFGIILLRKPKTADTTNEESLQFSEDELDDVNLDTINLSNSYIDFLEQAIQRNATKTKQQENIENEPTKDNANENGSAENENNDTDVNTAPAPNEAQSQLLLAREQFLLMEKAAADKTEHEIHFWDSIYDGMKKLLEQFSTIETVDSSSTKTNALTETQSKEKVFYIETQGKKIDGEVNKLKDIIYEQENALSSLKNSVVDAGSESTDNSELFSTLQDKIEAIERQLSDSKMCMEVLEMENNRLQEEVDKMDSRHEALFSDDTSKNPEDNDSLIDLDQMRGVVEQQEEKIQNLIETIESLEIDSAQTEKLKGTINDFARTAKDMMGCIAILEEENEKLQNINNQDSSNLTSDETDSSEELDTLKSKVSQLEEDIIKKDVAHAQLQDEFTSMETEYLAMYEAMHGDNP